MNLTLALFVIVTLFLLVLKFFVSYTGRVSERLLTHYFRDLEALLEHNQLPKEWSKQLKKMTQKQAIDKHSSDGHSWEEEAKAFLCKKLHALSDYFETSPFVDSPETRVVLLEELDVLRKHWEASELSDILASYDQTVGAACSP